MYARKEAEIDWGQQWSNAISPFTNLGVDAQGNTNYNYLGSALLGGGTGLITWALARLLGFNSGSSLTAGLLGALVTTGYSMGRQKYGEGFDPLNAEHWKGIIERKKPEDRSLDGGNTSEEDYNKAMEENAAAQAEAEKQIQAEQESKRQMQSVKDIQKNINEKRNNFTTKGDTTVQENAEILKREASRDKGSNTLTNNTAAIVAMNENKKKNDAAIKAQQTQQTLPVVQKRENIGPGGGTVMAPAPNTPVVNNPYNGKNLTLRNPATLSNPNPNSFTISGNMYPWLARQHQRPWQDRMNLLRKITQVEGKNSPRAQALDWSTNWVNRPMSELFPESNNQ